MFGVPNHHPKSQPFFDHVFTFSLVDGKVWFRNYQILEESGSLAEIGPRMVLNPIKIFEGSFCGQTLWENSTYVTPTAKRSLLRRAKAGKYQVEILKGGILDLTYEYRRSLPARPLMRLQGQQSQRTRWMKLRKCLPLLRRRLTMRRSKSQ